MPSPFAKIELVAPDLLPEGVAGLGVDEIRS
jgi:hypothetical protein